MPGINLIVKAGSDKITTQVDNNLALSEMICMVTIIGLLISLAATAPTQSARVILRTRSDSYLQTA